MHSLDTTHSATPPSPRLLEGRRVLVVEDDGRIRQEVVEALRGAGATVEACATHVEAGQALTTPRDLVILDLGLPDGDGLQLCRRLRDDGRADPVIVITARDALEKRVEGLDAGADDYLTKPFHLAELLARVRTVLRRVSTASRDTAAPSRKVLRAGHLELDAEARSVRKHGQPVSLTPREFDLLAFFMKHPRRAWTRAALLNAVWDRDDADDTRTVDLHVRRLRAKVEDEPGDPTFIVTIWGVGYSLQEPE
ncbi:MAG: response regulator transcription factor [Acidobacteriota bacterium]